MICVRCYNILWHLYFDFWVSDFAYERRHGVRALRVFRDIALIFCLSFTLAIVVTIFLGADYSNERLRAAAIIAFLYAVMALLFFWEWLINKVGYVPIEIFYVIMLNVVYIVVCRSHGWYFSTRGYILNAIFAIICYLLVKFIIFNIDNAEAKRINQILKKRKEGESH